MNHQFAESPFDSAVARLTDRWDRARAEWHDAVALRFDAEYRQPFKDLVTRVEAVRSALEDAMSAAESSDVRR
jgi:hypothetical protein